MQGDGSRGVHLMRGLVQSPAGHGRNHLKFVVSEPENIPGQGNGT
jgi:hypothetical protein